MDSMLVNQVWPNTNIRLLFICNIRVCIPLKCVSEFALNVSFIRTVTVEKSTIRMIIANIILLNMTQACHFRKHGLDRCSSYY